MRNNLFYGKLMAYIYSYIKMIYFLNWKSDPNDIEERGLIDYFNKKHRKIQVTAKSLITSFRVLLKDSKNNKIYKKLKIKLLQISKKTKLVYLHYPFLSACLKTIFRCLL